MFYVMNKAQKSKDAMPLSLKAMQYFTTALRHGNIAKAAVELNIAASAISVAIDQVEDEFGLTLVTRQRARGIAANASGCDIAKKCERLLEDYRALLLEGAELKQTLSGTLRVGYYAPVAPAFLPHILNSYLPPDANVQLILDECDNDQAQDGLLNGTYDVVLFAAVDVRPAIGFDPLINAPPFCLMPAHHPFACQTSVSMKQVMNEPLIVLNRPVAVSYYQALFAAEDRDTPPAAYANSTEMVRSLVAAGRGLAILNMRPTTDKTYYGADVVARPLSDILDPLTLAIGYDKSRPRRLVETFVSACKSHFAAQGPSQCVIAS